MNVVVILANRHFGWNRHLWDVEFTMYEAFMLLSPATYADFVPRVQNANIAAFTAKLLFVGAATFTRMSLIFFYYRLVRNSGIAWFRNVLHASMAFVVGLGIAFTIVGIFLCV